MKREATEHPKFSRLATMFKIQRWMAIGLMESIWHFTAKYAKAGDIGRWSNEEIACGIGWTDDPNILIEGLIKTKFIDKNKTHRLIIHGWYEHCEDSIHRSLARAGEYFADDQIPKMNRLTLAEKAECEILYKNKHKTECPVDVPGTPTVSPIDVPGMPEVRPALPCLALPVPVPKPLPQPAASDTAVDDNIAFLWSEYYSVLKTEITKRKETWTTPSNSTTKTIIEIGQQVGMKKMLDIIPLYFNFLIEKKLAFQWNNANGFVLQLPQLLKSIQLPSEQGRSQTLIWQDEACRQFESKYNETLPRNEKGDYQILNWYMDNYFKDEKRSGYNAILKIYKEISNGH